MSNLQLYSDCKNIPDVYCGPFNEERHYRALFNRNVPRKTDPATVSRVRVGYETYLEKATIPGSGAIYYVLHHGKQVIRADFTGTVPGFRLSSGGFTRPGGYPSRTTLDRLRAMTPARLVSHRGTLWCETRDALAFLVDRGYPTWGNGPTPLRPKADPARTYVEWVDDLIVDVDGFAVGAGRS